MKVYGWQGYRTEAGPRMQTRDIVAANSMAAAARAAGFKYPSQMFNLGETGNKHEIKTAMSAPGVVFWCPLDGYPQKFKRAGKD